MIQDYENWKPYLFSVNPGFGAQPMSNPPYHHQQLVDFPFNDQVNEFTIEKIIIGGTVQNNGAGNRAFELKSDHVLGFANFAESADDSIIKAVGELFNEETQIAISDGNYDFATPLHFKVKNPGGNMAVLFRWFAVPPFGIDTITNAFKFDTGATPLISWRLNVTGRYI